MGAVAGSKLSNGTEAAEFLPLTGEAHPWLVLLEPMGSKQEGTHRCRGKSNQASG